MKISINSKDADVKMFSLLESGSLFTDPQVDDSPLYIKTDEGESIDLLTGITEDKFASSYKVVDATDKYVIVDL
jgi:hypothetical protein